ncbi:hypothetical protein DM01DRAFT_1164901 [Hesseltinella vesiculosa]|uniref:Uncharacterized protein n=1 Tax=Hesseltinella vesiculosa TaxID=101127 RepID=A0A1X2GT86_9FUNG|nr:hypothetical protein DM01DRAFT_1164901 [Hesseltinella vesiculosa]
MSYQFLLSVCIVAFVVWYLLKDFPAWRKKQLASTVHDTDPQDKHLAMTSAQQQPPTQPDIGSRCNNPPKADNDKPLSPPPSPSLPKDNGQSGTADRDQPSDHPQRLSLWQYILMAPMAVAYLAGRLLLDTLRSGLYYSLLAAERAAPKLDAWLFDLVTVRLPKRLDDLEVWWAVTGQPWCQAKTQHWKEHTVPACIAALDVFFLNVYEAYQGAARAVSVMAQAWRSFRQGHDWKQLGMALATMAHDLCWQPLVQITHLLKLVFSGVRSGLVATYQDIRWLVLEALPAAVAWVASTQVVTWTGQCLGWCRHVVVPQLVHAGLVVCSPLLLGLTRVCLWTGDGVLWVLQSAPCQWLLHSCAAVAHGFVANVRRVAAWTAQVCQGFVDGVLVPLWQGYWKVMQPQLARIYQRVVAWAVDHWQNSTLLPFLGRCWRAVLSHLPWTPLGAWLANALRLVNSQLGRVLPLLVTGMQSWFRHSWALFTAATMHVQSLVQHYLPAVCQQLVITWQQLQLHLDWSRLRHTLEQFHGILGEHWALVFASLDRTLNDWSQQQADGLKAKKAKTA